MNIAIYKIVGQFSIFESHFWDAFDDLNYFFFINAKNIPKPIENT